MLSPESRQANLKNIARVGAAVIFTLFSSNGGTEVSAKLSGQILDVADEAIIAGYSDGEFLIVDLPGGLAPKDSIGKAKNYMKRKGCDIFESQIGVGLNREKTEEIVQVKNSCLSELK